MRRAALILGVVLFVSPNSTVAQRTSRPASPPTATQKIQRTDTLVIRQLPAETERTSWLKEWQWLVGIVLTSLLGFLIVALWEGVLLPMRTTRQVARALAAELSQSLQLLAGYIVIPDKKKVPSDFEIPTRVFDGVVDRVGELPTPALNLVLHFYAYAYALNKIASLTFPEALREWENAKASGNSAQIRRSERMLDSTIEVYQRYLRSALERGNATQAALFPFVNRGKIFGREPLNGRDG